MATAKFLLQGNSKVQNHRIMINELNSIEGQMLIATAFLRSEGVELLSWLFETSNSKIDFYVGIRNGITSRQGIENLLEKNIYPYIVDTGSSNFIFHPKIYLSYNAERAISIVGSANMTAGGMVKNIEASSILHLNMHEADDKQYVDNILSEFDKLNNVQNEKNIFKVAHKDQVDMLFDEGKVVDEEMVMNRYVSSNKSGKSITPRLHVYMENIQGLLKPKKKVVKDNTVSVNLENPSSNLLLDKVWESKPLKERDLNIPTGENTHATGSMTLKKGVYDDIDQRVYFRNEVFDDLNWENRKKTSSHLEYADVEIYIIIEGINYGKYTLELKHDPRTNTKSYLQNNAMTHLLWKDAKEIIGNRNLLGKRMEVYKAKDKNEYVINIDE